jgi:hypothetical protein
MAVVLLGMVLTRDGDRREVDYVEPQSGKRETERPNGGTGGIGDKAMASVDPAETPPISGQEFSLQVPDEPLPGQKLSPCAPRDAFVEFKGGCWMPAAGSKPPCEKDWYEYNGRCYFPVFTSERLPTSEDPP